MKTRFAIICKGNYVGKSYTNKDEAIEYARTFPPPATVIIDTSVNWGAIVYENDERRTTKTQ